MIGYSGDNLTLRQARGITTSRSCKISFLKNLKNQKKYLIKLSKQNLNDTLEILRWNLDHNIKLYRLGIYLFPFINHPDYSWSIEQVSKEILAISDFINKNNLRISIHLPQYINLGSTNLLILQNSLNEINFYTEVLDKISPDFIHKIIIHSNKIEDSRAETLKRMIKNYSMIPETSRRRLVFENDEVHWTIRQLYPLYLEAGATILIDYLHWQINHESESNWEDDLNLALSTWKEKPKIHYSEQAEGKPRGAHSFYIKDIIVNERFDTMVEAKGKELAILPFIK